MRTGKNQEGYSDPTASNAVAAVRNEELHIEMRVNTLIKVLKYIIHTSGFELTERISLKDIKTGRTYK